MKETYISENDDWKRTFENLPKFQDGKEIVYTIKQKKIKGYKTEITGLDVINTHEPETIMVEGSIMWDDSNNKDNIRKSVVTVKLIIDGIPTEHTTTASRDTGWKYSLGTFPKYESGKEIEYKIEEDPIDGYEPDYYGFNIRNVHKAGTLEKSDSHANNETNVKGNNIWLWIVVMISCIIIILIIIKRKNNKD